MSSSFVSRHVVKDPKICHGNAVFRGTRVLVADVLDQVANGMDWEAIIEQWHGSVTKEAIADALRLAREALEVYSPPIASEPLNP